MKLTCPPLQTVRSADGTPVVVNYPPAVVTPTPATVTYSKASGSVFPLGTTPVVVKATWPNGKTLTGTFKVQVTAAVPVDCVLTSWRLDTAGPWGPCQADGTQERTETWVRSVVTPPANGGAVCGPLVEIRIGVRPCVVVVPPPDPPPPPPPPVGITTTLTDATGGVWTLGLPDAGGIAGYQTLRDGVHMGGGYGVGYMHTSTGAVAVMNTPGDWYAFVNGAWAGTNDPRTDPSAPPPPPPPLRPPAPAPQGLLNMTPEVSPAPPGYLARLIAPVKGMHFTAGQPLRLFGQTLDPNQWQCPPGHPPYVCPDHLFTFFVDGISVGAVRPDPVNNGMWELRLPAGLPAGRHLITVSFVAHGGQVILGDPAGIPIVIDAPPVHARTINMLADIVLSGANALDWTDVTVHGNGFRVTTAPGYSGAITIRNAALFGVGGFGWGIDVTTTGAFIFDQVLHEASGPIHLVANGTAPITIRGSELRQNDWVTYSSSDPAASPLLEVSGTSTGVKVLAGNNYGGGHVSITGMTGWKFGGLTPVESNVLMGLRAVLGLTRVSNSTLQGHYQHHTYDGNWSQGFNLTVSESDVLAEHSVIRNGSWPVQSFGGEFRYSLVADHGGHDLWRSWSNGTFMHHNIFACIGPAADLGGMFWTYQGEKGLRFEDNTVDGGSRSYGAPVILLGAGATADSIQRCLIRGFSPTAASLGGALISGEPGSVAVADYNAWDNPLAGSTPHYGAGVVASAPGAHDVNSAPLLYTPDTSYRIDESAIWQRTFSVFDVLAYYRTMYTLQTPGGKGAIGGSGSDLFGRPTYVPPPPPPPPVPGSTLWVKPSVLAAATLPTSPDHPLWLQAKAAADAELLQAPTYGYAGSGFVGPLSNLGVAYQATHDARYAAKAKEIVAAMLALGPDAILPDSGYPTRNLVVALALAFNWCGAACTEAERAAMIAIGNAWFDHYKARHILDADGPAWSNYYGGHQLGFGLWGLGSIGVNPRGQEIADYLRQQWAIVQTAFTSGVFQDGEVVEGYTYGVNHFVRLLQYAMAVKSITGEDIASGMADKILRSLIANRKPDRWRFPDEADYAGDYTGIMDQTLIVMLTGLCSPTYAGYAQQFLNTMNPSAGMAYPAVRSLLWGAVVSPTTHNFPLTFRAKGTGRVVTRTSWNDDAIWTSYRAGAQFLGGHANRLAGHPAIHRRGDYLIVNAGQWKGPGGWGGNPQVYDGRSCRGNTLLYPSLWNIDYEGGQGYWGEEKILAFNDGPLGIWTLTDLSKAYNRGDGPTGLVSFIETFVTLPNGTSILRAHVTGPAPTSALAFHSPGLWRIDGSRATVPVGSSQLVVTALTPQTLAQFDDTVSGEDLTPTTHRLEVRAATADATYLLVLQPGAAGETPEPVTALPDGVQVGARHVVFDATGAVSLT